MSFVDGVLSNIISDLILAAAITTTALGVSFWKFSGISRRLRAKIRPQPPFKHIIRQDFPSGTAVHLNDPSPFHNPLSKFDTEELVSFYQFLNQAHVYDGRVVRLDQLNPRIELSVVRFFDLISTNLTRYPENNNRVKGNLRRLSALRRWLAIRSSIETVQASSRLVIRHSTTVDEVLRNRTMANPVAVSALIRDQKDSVLLALRSARVAVASGLFGATASGTVGTEDLSQPSPFLAAANRELEEEVGIQTHLQADEVVIPFQKLQPVVTFSAQLEGEWSDYCDAIAVASDPDEEADGFFLLDLLDINKVARFLRLNVCSEVLAYQIWKAAVEVHGKDLMVRAWKKATWRPAVGGWSTCLTPVTT